MQQISTLPITSFQWNLNFWRDRSKEQFHLRGWVGVLVDWQKGRRSSEGWGKCRTDQSWDEQTRAVLYILRFAYWLQILRKHTSIFVVIVVTIIRNLTTDWIEGPENLQFRWFDRGALISGFNSPLYILLPSWHCLNSAPRNFILHVNDGYILQSFVWTRINFFDKNHIHWIHWRAWVNNKGTK